MTVAARTRTKIPAWRPPLREAFSLAARPIVFYGVFTLLGFLAFVITILSYEGGSDDWQVVIACFAGVVGIATGVLISLKRLRVIPIFIGCAASIAFATFMGIEMESDLPKTFFISLLFFLMGLPCGLLALQHRFELLASFWPGVGWIGAVMVILNEEDRVTNWEQDKLSAWLPIPLALLAGFLFFLLAYFAAKQSMRVRIWQSLSGAVERRVSKKVELAAVPKRNFVPMLVIALLLFIFTAVLSPYLWRTGRGDRPSNHEGTPDVHVPEVPTEAIVNVVEKLATAAGKAAQTLWPLLLLPFLYRPAKRALITRHLKSPLFPTPPSERVDNLWEYVRIAAEDVGVVPTASDSVSELLARIAEKRPVTTALLRSAEIYTRTRYGFVIRPGDPMSMREPSFMAARELPIRDDEVGAGEKLVASAALRDPSTR